MRERLNKSTFIPRAKEIHGDKYDYSKSEYVKAKEPVVIICPKHGEFLQRPQDHILKSCGCPKCKADKIIETHSYTKEKFLELAKIRHGDRYDYSQMDYVNYSTDIKIVCPLHGEFLLNPKNHLEGTGCPKCGREKANKSESYTLSDFIAKANKVHYNKYNYSLTQYLNSLSKVLIICPEHGEFWQTPANHLAGQGCPKCRLVGQTKLFNRLKEAFPLLNIVFEANNKTIEWIENQRIDIYIPSINFAIELMGPQHYQEVSYFKNGCSLQITQERDNRKRVKCREHGCTLAELPYYYTKEEFNNLVSEVTKKLEELMKEYSDDETSLKDRDNAAIEAGKLLVEEILNNTVDNTNNLL